MTTNVDNVAVRAILWDIFKDIGVAIMPPWSSDTTKELAKDLTNVLCDINYGNYKVISFIGFPHVEHFIWDKMAALRAKLFQTGFSLTCQRRLPQHFATLPHAHFSTKNPSSANMLSNPDQFTSNFKEQAILQDVRGLDTTKENLLDDVITMTNMTPEEREDMERVASFMCANNKQIQQRKVAHLVKKYERFPGDTGSTEVQGTTDTHSFFVTMTTFTTALLPFSLSCCVVGKNRESQGAHGKPQEGWFSPVSVYLPEKLLKITMFLCRICTQNLDWTFYSTDEGN